MGAGFSHRNPDTPGKFQQRHYEAIARVTRRELDDAPYDPEASEEINKLRIMMYRRMVLSYVCALDAMFRCDNMHYRSHRFFEACGVTYNELRYVGAVPIEET